MIMTYDDYLQAVDNACRHTPTANRRLGQTYFNILYQHRPDLANLIRGTFFDPFHIDNRIPDFLTWTQNNWEPT